MKCVKHSSLVEAVDLTKYYPVTKGTIVKRKLGLVRAVEGVNFSINKKETLALVGESGSGKTTIARLVVRAIKPTSGRILFDGSDIATMQDRELRSVRRRIGFVFQDPFSSLDPRQRVGDIVGEPLKIVGEHSAGDIKQRTRALLERVGLARDAAVKYPHQFSGGQRQRIALARALSTSPDLIIADEPVSALDVSVQSKIVNLMKDIQDEMGMAYLFISHDLSIVRNICDKVCVMYLGQIIESGTVEQVFARPLHPYTRALLASIPVPDSEEMRKRTFVLKGEIPSPLNPPSGCRFHTRCPYAQNNCRDQQPALEDVGQGHLVSCHYSRDIEIGKLQASELTSNA